MHTPDNTRRSFVTLGIAGDASVILQKRECYEKMIFTTLFIGMFSISAFASEFCNGFERGYITGYKQSSGSGFCPLSFCPFQPFKGFNDPESDYKHGYIIGYEKGLQKCRK